MIELANIKLTILIPTVPSRENDLHRMLASLYPQITDEVELIVMLDNKKRTLGAKRKEMMRLAKGEYVAFLDDDDRITDDYVSSLLEATKEKADVICFDVEVSIEGGPWKKVLYSKIFEDGFSNGIFYRKPNHLMCFKREVAMKEEYNDLQFGEDSDYSKRIVGHIGTETHIGKTLYYYSAIRSKTECR